MKIPMNFQLLFMFCITWLCGISMIEAQTNDDKADAPTFFDTLYRLPLTHLELHVNLDSLLKGKFTQNEHTGTLL
ncbi:MAG: hypothetical protein OEQ53_22790, partial [Saprospiraceae bacterium]|nr:hypothetical protein [Saprospiraceae bacterium]